MNRRAFVLVAGLLASSLATPSYAGGPWHRPARKVAAQAQRVVRHASFDWDDNLVKMITRMYLRSKTGAPEIALSTAEWAHVKSEVGKPGPYEDRYLDNDFATGGFREFRDVGMENIFLRHLKLTVESTENWQGPSWKAFVKQLSTPEGARRTSLITAREHEQDTIYEGLVYLQQQGLIRYLPPKNQIFAVNRPGFAVDGKSVTGTTPERKLTVQRFELDRLNREAARDRSVNYRYHFSDDDWANFDGTRVGLSPEVVAGRWKSVGVKLHFTGLDHPVNPPQSTELRAPN